MRTVTPQSRVLRALLVLPAATAVALTGPAAFAAPAAGAPCYVRLAHFSPDTPNVDVYLTSFSRPNWKVVLRGVGYGAVSPYQRVQPDTYTISMRPAGAAPTTAPVISTTVRGVPDAAFTVAGVGKFASLGLQVLRDDLRLPPAGQARARVVQAAAAAGTVTVEAVNGPAIAQAVKFAETTSYATVPAGTWSLRVRGSGGAPAATLSATLKAGDVYSLLVLDAPGGGLTLEARTDAVSTAVAPTGGVETGAGGTAAGAGAGGAGGTGGTAGAGRGAGAVLVPVGLGLAGVLLLVTAGMLRRRPQPIG